MDSRARLWMEGRGQRSERCEHNNTWKSRGPEASRILNVDTMLEYLQYLCGHGLRLSFVWGNNALHKQSVVFMEMMRTK